MDNFSAEAVMEQLRKLGPCNCKSEDCPWWQAILKSGLAITSALDDAKSQQEGKIKELESEVTRLFQKNTTATEVELRERIKELEALVDEMSGFISEALALARLKYTPSFVKDEGKKEEPNGNKG